MTWTEWNSKVNLISKSELERIATGNVILELQSDHRQDEFKWLFSSTNPTESMKADDLLHDMFLKEQDMVIERLVQAKSMFGTVRFKNPIVIAGMRVILIQDEPQHRLQAGDIGILLKENLEPGDERGSLTETHAYPYILRFSVNTCSRLAALRPKFFPDSQGAVDIESQTVQYQILGTVLESQPGHEPIISTEPPLPLPRDQAQSDPKEEESYLIREMAKKEGKMLLSQRSNACHARSRTQLAQSAASIVVFLLILNWQALTLCRLPRRCQLLEVLGHKSRI